MGIDRDDRDARQVRIDEMIREFQDARRRRLVKVTEPAGDTRAEPDAEIAPGGPPPSREGAR